MTVIKNLKLEGIRKLPSFLNSSAIAFTMAERRSSASEQRVECWKHVTRFLRVEQESRFHILGWALAFTMAEILISLTIIGVIAAITLPALQANINESAWKAQRKALYSRMSQAIALMPSLNGYGDFIGEWDNDVVTPTTDTAAERFVTDGLAKVLNINNICSIPMSTTDNTERHKLLSKCGIPDNLTTMTNSKMPFPTNLSELNPMFTSTYYNASGVPYYNPQHNIDTNAAAFETKNGESIAVFYNPYCQLNNNDTHWTATLPNMCADFVYDLNGKKGPNSVGKDIGFITVMYPVDGEILAPLPYSKNGATVSKKHEDALAICRAMDKGSRLPNRDELISMFYNKQLIGMNYEGVYWSSTLKENDAWAVSFAHAGYKGFYNRNTSFLVRCIKR